ncbi:MAG: hypothetical protein AAGD11_01365 [Planctomycetota bacterium]
MPQGIRYSIKEFMIIVSLLSVSLTALFYTWESDEYFFYLPVCGAFFGGILGAAVGLKADKRKNFFVVTLVGAVVGFLLAMIPMWGWINFV